MKNTMDGTSSTVEIPELKIKNFRIATEITQNEAQNKPEKKKKIKTLATHTKT